MRYYSAHTPPGGDPGEAVLIKEGFCWPALVFGPLWLAYRRMWRELAIFIAALAAVGGLQAMGLTQTGGWLAVLLQLLLGFEGAGLYRRALARRGFKEAGMVAGANLDEAELRLARAAAGEA